MSLEAFSGKAAAYAAARPGYPAAVVDYLGSLASSVEIPNPVIADVGAGTGKLTSLLAQHGYQIYGIEPNDDMRAELAKTLADYPNAVVLDGSAETTGIPDNSVDLIVCAQALHWFDPAEFWAECRRIGKPNAQVTAVYNNMDGGRGGQHRWEAVDKFFTNPTVAEFSQPVSYSRDSWQQYMLSHSHSPLPDDERYEGYLREINGIFDAEQIGGTLTRIVTTTVYSQPIHDAAIHDAAADDAVARSTVVGAGAKPDAVTTGSPSKRRILRPRHWAFIALTVLVAGLEILQGTNAWHIGGDWWRGNQGLVARELALPLENDASDADILAAFNEMCDNPAVATPDYDDKFTAVYECPVADTHLWISIDRGNGDAVRYINLAPCFAGMDPTNTLSGGRWMIDNIGDPIPEAVLAKFPAQVMRWYCPPEEESALP